jgi:V/A-type H+-transporting ATPase subunit K
LASQAAGDLALTNGQGDGMTWWIPVSAAAVMAISAIATAWAQSRIGSAGAASLAEKPELSNTIVILVAIPETMTILGFVVAMMLILRAG